MPIGGTYKINGWAGEKVAFDARLTIVWCPDCGITYAIPAEVHKRLADYSSAPYPTNYASTYCPNGHTWHYTGKNEAQRERKRADAAEHELARAREQREYHRRHAAAMKGQLTKIRNRIAAGICPSCRANLGDRVRDHMVKEHPDFAVPEEAE